MNRALHRRGRFFGDVHHRRALPSPRQVRIAYAYALLNQRRHLAEQGRCPSLAELDPYSSSIYFTGWADGISPLGPRAPPSPVSAPRSWLASVGWRRHGLLSPAEVPGARPA